MQASATLLAQLCNKKQSPCLDFFFFFIPASHLCTFSSLHVLTAVAGRTGVGLSGRGCLLEAS